MSCCTYSCDAAWLCLNCTVLRQILLVLMWSKKRRRSFTKPFYPTTSSVNTREKKPKNTYTNTNTKYTRKESPTKNKTKQIKNRLMQHHTTGSPHPPVEPKRRRSLRNLPGPHLLHHEVPQRIANDERSHQHLLRPATQNVDRPREYPGRVGVRGRVGDWRGGCRRDLRVFPGGWEGKNRRASPALFFFLLVCAKPRP